MKFYDWSIAPNPRRVRIFLAEKGIDVPTEQAGPPDKAVLYPAFLDKHPHRRTPLLELDDGTCIAEAMAICRYLEELHPTPPLMGTDARERALVDMWERSAEQEGLVAASEVLRNTARSFSGRGVPGVPGPIEQIPALAERGRARLAWFFEKFDRQLADNEFVAGDRFSVADVTTLCAVDFARFCKLEIPESCGNFRRWREAVSVRPAARL